MYILLVVRHIRNKMFDYTIEIHDRNNHIRNRGRSIEEGLPEPILHFRLKKQIKNKSIFLMIISILIGSGIAIIVFGMLPNMDWLNMHS